MLDNFAKKDFKYCSLGQSCAVCSRGCCDDLLDVCSALDVMIFITALPSQSCLEQTDRRAAFTEMDRTYRAHSKKDQSNLSAIIIMKPSVRER